MVTEDLKKEYEEFIKLMGNISEYSEEEKEKLFIRNKIYQITAELTSTDYQAIKYSEGWFTEEEYAPIKQHREELREKIRQLEEKLV